MSNRDTVLVAIEQALAASAVGLTVKLYYREQILEGDMPCVNLKRSSDISNGPLSKSGNTAKLGLTATFYAVGDDSYQQIDAPEQAFKAALLGLQGSVFCITNIDVATNWDEDALAEPYAAAAVGILIDYIV